MGATFQINQPVASRIRGFLKAISVRIKSKAAHAPALVVREKREEITN